MMNSIIDAMLRYNRTVLVLLLVPPRALPGELHLTVPSGWVSQAMVLLPPLRQQVQARPLQGNAAASACVFLWADGCGGGDDGDAAIVSLSV